MTRGPDTTPREQERASMPTPSSVNEKVIAHTPGPWIVEPIPPDAHTDPEVHIDDDSAFWIADERANGDVLALVQITPREPLEAEANGRLIAAAPDLLHDASYNDIAYTWLAEQMNVITDNAKHWTADQIAALAQDLRIGIERNQKRTRAAIAKAEGRS